MNNTKEELVVLGRGPLGLFTSYILLKKGYQVINIDSGIGLNLLRERININSNINWMDLQHKPSLNKKASNYEWGGACMGFNPRFKNDDSIVSIDDINESYSKVAKVLILDNFDFSINKPNTNRHPKDNEKFQYIYAKISKNVFLKQLQKNIESNANYKFIDNAIATEVHSENKKQYLKYLEYPSFNSNEIYYSKLFLCLGTIENTRLLLNSRDYIKINNNQLGGNLTDHISFKFAEIFLKEYEDISNDFNYQEEDVNSKIWPRLELTDNSQPASFCYLDFFQKNNQNILNFIKKKNEGSANMNLFVEKKKESESFIDIKKREHVSEINVNFKLSKDEISNYVELISKYINFFNENYKNINIVENKAFLDIKNFSTTNHPSSTTIMSKFPEDGVVDKFSRLWNEKNIYIFGSSVFERAENIHPTFAAMALCHYSLENSLN